MQTLKVLKVFCALKAQAEEAFGPHMLAYAEDSVAIVSTKLAAYMEAEIVHQAYWKRMEDEGVVNEKLLTKRGQVLRGAAL